MPARPDLPADLVILCEFCTPKKSPIDGRWLRACKDCTGADEWCECLFCPLVPEEAE